MTILGGVLLASLALATLAAFGLSRTLKRETHGWQGQHEQRKAAK